MSGRVCWRDQFTSCIHSGIYLRYILCFVSVLRTLNREIRLSRRFIGSSYRIVGKLTFLTRTRPDIQFYVNSISRCQVAPTMWDIESALTIVRYVKGTLDLGLVYWLDCQKVFILERRNKR